MRESVMDLERQHMQDQRGWVGEYGRCRAICSHTSIPRKTKKKEERTKTTNTHTLPNIAPIQDPGMCRRISDPYADGNGTQNRLNFDPYADGKPEFWPDVYMTFPSVGNANCTR